MTTALLFIMAWIGVKLIVTGALVPVLADLIVVQPEGGPEEFDGVDEVHGQAYTVVRAQLAAPAVKLTVRLCWVCVFLKAGGELAVN